MNEIEKRVLRQNHTVLVNNLDLSGSTVLDQLQEEEIISADEQEDILARGLQKDQNARFLFLLKRINASKDPFEKFIKVLDISHQFLAEALRTSLKTFRDCDTKMNFKCFYCTLIENLIPNHVSHFFYEEGLISEDDLEDINNPATSRNTRVKRLLALLKENVDKTRVNELLWDGLKPKYSYVLERTSICLECQCVTNFGEAQECLKPQGVELVQSKTFKCNENTHSDITNHQDLQTRNDQRIKKTAGNRQSNFKNKNSKATEIISCSSETTEVIDQNDLKPNSDTHTDVLESQNVPVISKQGLQASDKRLKDITYTREDSIQKSLKYCDSQPKRNKIRNSSKQHMTLHVAHSTANSAPIQNLKKTSYPVLRDVCKSLPNERKVMAKCTKLWEQLFHFREKGDWESFNLFSRTAMEKFSSNPDIVVSLYQVDMVVASFYKTDKIKAYSTYEKAMKIIPKTIVPSWYLGRFIPLKMILLSRDKNFKEASCLSEEAQQAVSTLGPCLSTACVNFCEAIYLGHIFTCTRNDTKSAIRLAQRVKQCFLTAIEHYQREPLYPVEPFVNQVYLLLALFSLGVDLKFTYFMTTWKVNDDDLRIAEHYINRFENNCWEKSTNWSRMLFFIARGEQHKQRNNFSRSMDYYTEAHTYATTGNYTDQLTFISKNIEVIGEKIKNRAVANIDTLQNVDEMLMELLESSDY